MNTYLVMYDLNGNEPRIDYRLLIGAIKLLGKTRKFQLSTWFLATTLSEVEIRDRLRKFVDSDDSLLVVKFNAYASYNIDRSSLLSVEATWAFMHEEDGKRSIG